jgi:hypothetical protein
MLGRLKPMCVLDNTARIPLARNAICCRPLGRRSRAGAVGSVSGSYHRDDVMCWGLLVLLFRCTRHPSERNCPRDGDETYRLGKTPSARRPTIFIPGAQQLRRDGVLALGQSTLGGPQ